MPPQAVADTSALLSLGVGAQMAQQQSFDPLDCFVQTRTVLIPDRVKQETIDAAQFKPPDKTAHGADAVLDYISSGDITVEQTAVPPGLAPSLDRGERKAINLANDKGADEFVCDEIDPSNSNVISQNLSNLGSLLSSLELVCKFVVENKIAKPDAEKLLFAIGSYRSWQNNPHFRQIMNRF